MIDTESLEAAAGYAARRAALTERTVEVWTLDNLRAHVTMEAPLGAWVLDVVRPGAEE